MKIHIVQQGDTLYEIAQQYQVDFEKLKKANPQLSDPDMIMPGMKIKIPGSVAKAKKEGVKKGAKKDTSKKGISAKKEPLELEPSQMETPKAADLPKVELPSEKKPLDNKKDEETLKHLLSKFSPAVLKNLLKEIKPDLMLEIKNEVHLDLTKHQQLNIEMKQPKLPEMHAAQPTPPPIMPQMHPQQQPCPPFSPYVPSIQSMPETQVSPTAGMGEAAWPAPVQKQPKPCPPGWPYQGFQGSAAWPHYGAGAAPAPTAYYPAPMAPVYGYPVGGFQSGFPTLPHPLPASPGYQAHPESREESPEEENK